MVKEIKLNHTVIQLMKYEDELVNGLHKVDIEFEVKSEDYHDIAELLYEGSFHISVPEKDLTFNGSIQKYSTSITNLYEEGQVGTYYVSLMEVAN